MGKQNEREKRKIILMWLTTAGNLAPGNTLYIPMKHGVARTQYRNLGKQIIEEMEALFDKSIFHNLYIYGTSKRGVPYLAIEKCNKITNTSFIVDKNKRERSLQLLVKSRYTRKAQIIMMLSEGFTNDEIIKALGASITPEELKLLK